LAEAEAKGWIVVDMQRDWKRVFALERSLVGRLAAPNFAFGQKITHRAGLEI
jgi:hypothetical protein